MYTKKILLGGITAGIVIFVVSLLFSGLVQMIGDFDMVELDGMRDMDDPIAFLFFLHPWVLGFALAFVYPYLEKSLKGYTFQNGVIFGLLMWIVIAIPSAFLVFSSMDYPLGFTINSVIGPLIYLVASGFVIEKTFMFLK